MHLKLSVLSPCGLTGGGGREERWVLRKGEPVAHMSARLFPRPEGHVRKKAQSRSRGLSLGDSAQHTHG